MIALADVGRSGSPAEALARARTARLRVLEGADVVVSHTRLVGEATQALGRFQRVEHARAPFVVRETGGPPWVLAEGGHLVRIALAHASVLLPTPPDKILNRNVRPLLGALRGAAPRGAGSSGVAMYGGRDFVSEGEAIVAVLAWGRGTRGEVILDVALPAPDGTLLDPGPSSGAPWFLGKTAAPRQDDGALPARIAEAYAKGAAPVVLEDAPLPAPPWTFEAPVVHTAGVEIGSASVVRVERQIGLAGDFFADDALEGLGEVLAALVARGDEAAIAAALAPVGIEGVRYPAATFAQLLAQTRLSAG